MADYDIAAAFDAIEEELISSMIRNMKRHHVEEINEQKQWEMWQVKQLEALEKYKKANQKKFGKEFSTINTQIEVAIREANQKGYMGQETKILEMIQKGFKGAKAPTDAMQASFFKVNDRKLDALIQATTYDMKKAETAVLRMANDQYRKVIFNAQVYANTGAGTYEKSVDMATKDFLSSGINCVVYKNGARHTIADYADMALRTASKRAYLQGEGTKRQEWGLHLVIMNKRGCPCPKCLPFVGKIMIDDVWSGGSKKDGNYPLMSTAIAAGLYHPRCKDSHTTYFPGITTVDAKYNKKEIANLEEQAKSEAKQQYRERQKKKFQRLADNSLDQENKEKYLRLAENADTITLQDKISDANTQIDNLKEQFSVSTDGYSYDEWFKDYESIEDGFGGITAENSAEVKKLQEIDSKLKDITRKKSDLLSQKPKRKQLETEFSGKILDDKLEEYNKKALEQIKQDTGYSEKDAEIFHDALMEYFGGDYESILAGETETAKIINAGLDRMPTYDGSIYRGLCFSEYSDGNITQFTHLKVGDRIPTKGTLSSWSIDKVVAEAFGSASTQAAESSTVILECVNNKTGVGVQHISKFGSREAEVLSNADYEVIEMVSESKYDYVSKHKELLYFPDDLTTLESELKQQVVCVIKVKEV